MQEFNGVKYKKNERGYYVTKSLPRRKMHRDVWEFYKGPIPEGYVVHHKDEDKGNNEISNLQCISASLHAKLHSAFKTKNPKAQYTKPKYTKLVGAVYDKENTCAICEQKFKICKYTKTQKYCSRTCANKAKHDKYKIEHTCAVCRSVFLGRNWVVRKTCSAECRKKLISRTKRSSSA